MITPETLSETPTEEAFRIAEAAIEPALVSRPSSMDEDGSDGLSVKVTLPAKVYWS